mmetsp:Transcript_15136/g.29872  ORF Transcript_15136/g.29872 Transcript_15136/m.29872 type:complete len:273 (+) Transcript_15136:48-866(+)
MHVEARETSSPRAAQRSTGGPIGARTLKEAGEPGRCTSPMSSGVEGTLSPLSLLPGSTSAASRDSLRAQSALRATSLRQWAELQMWQKSLVPLGDTREMRALRPRFISADQAGDRLDMSSDAWSSAHTIEIDRDDLTEGRQSPLNALKRSGSIVGRHRSNPSDSQRTSLQDERPGPLRKTRSALTVRWPDEGGEGKLTKELIYMPVVRSPKAAQSSGPSKSGNSAAGEGLKAFLQGMVRSMSLRSLSLSGARGRCEVRAVSVRPKVVAVRSG